MDTTYLLWALAIGTLASVSLPLGSALGLLLRPAPAHAALLAAFGAGAIIAALALELVAPTVEAAAEAHHGAGSFGVLVGGALVGGVLFVALDHLLASRGGFLRKASTAMHWFTGQQQTRHEAWLKNLCAIPLMRKMPAERVGEIVRDVRLEPFRAGEKLFAEGEAAEKLYFVCSGEIELRRAGEHVDSVTTGGIFGELPLLANLPRTVSAEATRAGEVLTLRREDLERWRAECPELDQGLRELASQRLAEIRRRDEEMSLEEQRWGESAIAALRTGAVIPSPAEVQQAADEHSGSPLAVWLGLLLDGVPESLVIGAGFVGLLTAQTASSGAPAFADVVPYTLVAGVFLSNFPEALSSSLGMRAQGWSTVRVLGMWSLLMALTALATGVGYLLGETLSHSARVAIEGIAVGAALTAVVATMIPEAVHLAGSGGRVGLATLVGFLAASGFKLLE